MAHLSDNRIHCFDNVAAILFVAALSGYDCCLVEDKYSVSLYIYVSPTDQPY